jgi:hypothetical protein
MKVIVTKSQFQKIVFNLLDALYGPNIRATYNRHIDIYEIFANDDEEIFRVYTKGGRAKGCKLDVFVPSDTTETIKGYIPQAILKKKLFSKTLLLYINEKTGLNIDCIEFWYPTTTKGTEHETKYNFSIKKNKRINP